MRYKNIFKNDCMAPCMPPTKVYTPIAENPARQVNPQHAAVSATE